ncbi:hypothetical protein ACJJTC_002508 [Scirpophaga incertulas]
MQIISLFITLIAIVNGVFIPNLSEKCFRCLCHVTGCDMAHACTGGYCGPFYISRLYWTDAGRPTLPTDDPDRIEAFEDCTRDYYCSLKTIEGYMAKYGKDCNNDGVTNCYDYMMINYNGGVDCSPPLYLSPRGLEILSKFEQCELAN